MLFAKFVTETNKQLFPSGSCKYEFENFRHTGPLQSDWSKSVLAPPLSIPKCLPFFHAKSMCLAQGVDTLACSGRAHPSTSNLQKIGIMCKRKQKPQVRLWKGKRKSESVIQHFGLPLCSLWWQIRILCLILKLNMSPFK